MSDVIVQVQSSDDDFTSSDIDDVQNAGTNVVSKESSNRTVHDPSSQTHNQRVGEGGQK